MYKGRKTSKRIFTSLLTAALVMSTLEGATFSVSATQLETVVTEGQNVETKETEPATEAETELVSEETMETEVSVETEEDVTEEIVETETETKTETETEVETDTAVETEVMVETEETEDNSSVMMETLTVSEEYGDVLASGNCGATYQDESGDTKTYDVKWAVYDSNADGDNAVNTGDVLVISGSGEMENYSDGTAPWYSYGTSLKHLDVKSGVTSIGDSAFGKCSSLTAIELPVGVTSIGYCAFYYCSSLESIKLPVGLTSIGNSAFECCSSLASIELPNTLEKLGNFSFANCSSLTSIELPESVTSIGSSVFFRCSSLVNVELPESVTSIGNWLFANCSSLASIELPDNVTRIGNYAFYNCSSLVSIELPDSVSIIEGYAFYKCSSLERIELSAGVTSTGFCAFADCSSLVSIELPDSMISIEKSTFYNCSSLTSIKIPKSVTSIGANACFGTNSELKIYTQSSDWCDTYAGTNWGNSTVEVVKPYRISYQLGETENTIAEVYADGIRSYTFKEGEPPEEYVWYDEGYNNGRGLYVQSGMTVENIRDDITLVQADMDGFYVTEIPEQTYTGKALKPEPAVYDCNTGKRLEKGKDYTVTYKNNVNAYTLTVEERSFDYTKAPRLIIKGKGNYDKSLTLYFTIQPKNIGDKDIIANDLLVEYTGKVQKKVPVITYNNKKLSGTVKPVTGQTLKNSKDFVYSYPALDDEQTRANAYKENGTYGIFMEGTGNFTGSRTVNMTIISKGTDLTKASIKKIPEQTYTGKKIILEESRLVVTAKVNGKNVTLKQDTDYSVSYKNNKNVGTATVTITGKGDYTGTKTATFKIKGTSLTKAKVSGLENKVYNGEAQTQQLTLELSSKMGGGNESVVIESVLREGKDYTVSYDKNVNVGTAKITITGKGGYTGTIKKTFKITPYNFAGETDGEGKTKENSLLTEENGLLQKKDGEISVKYMKGGSQPAVQLSFNGTGLTAGKDYTVTYSNHKKVSGLKPGDEGYNEKKAPTITIKGKGNFTGNIKKIFIITAKDLQDSEEPVTIIVADKAVTTKKGGYISKPVLTDADGKVLKAGTDYETPVYTMVVTDGTTQEDKNVTLGTKDTVEAGAEVTVTVKGKGAYTGELTATYRITEKNFGAVKVQSIQKDYTGKEVTLTASDFAIADGTGKGVSKVTFGSGKNKVELEYGKDFEIVEGSYRNNLKKGTASVTLRGLGEYGGTKTIKFKIGVRGFFWWLFK